MDLNTTYMGLKLKNPIVPSASPLSQQVSGIKALEDAGAAAVVMFSIFEEQIHHDAEALDHLMTAGAESFSEAMSYFPAQESYAVGPDRYLEIISRASKECQIPIIGSLNGVSNEGWIDYAKKIEQAGAKGLELNVYYIPTDPNMTGTDVEKMYLDTVRAVKGAVQIPVAVKLSPFFSSMANMARRLSQSGADALVLFNRFYQPDFDLKEMDVLSDLQLSTSAEMRLPLRWMAILHGQNPCSLAATTGVHTAEDAAKYILAGADAVMMCSSLLKNGPQHISRVLKGLKAFMEEKEYAGINEMRGAMSQQHVANASAFERANYIRVLEEYKGKFASA